MSTHSDKSNFMNQMLNNSVDQSVNNSNKKPSKVTNNRPKHHKSVKHNNTTKPHKTGRSSKIKQVSHEKSPFMQVHEKKPVKYENIRVRYPVFKDLKRAQYANSIKSRSDLLEMMYDYCKPALFSSKITKQRAKKADKIMKNQEQLKK